MASLLAFIFCSVVLVVALIAVAKLFGGKAEGPRTVNPYIAVAPPASPPQVPPSSLEPRPAQAPLIPGTSAPRSMLSLDQYAAFDQLVARWAARGMISSATASEVRDLISAEAAALNLPAPVPVPYVPGPAPASAPTPAPAPLTVQLPVAPAPVTPQPVSQPVAPPPLAVALPPTHPSRPSRLQGIGAALLALDTRRVLLFVGTFLLIMSSITLVVFNWSSLPPIIQFAILAGTTAAIWAGGTWMIRQPDLATAGGNLQVVAALLMPVVGFALGRPGLLSLEPRPAWLLASALSLIAYVLAAWRTGRAFYSGAAAAAALSTLLASLGGVELGWQPAPALLLLAAMLPVSRALKSGGAPKLAAGPRWVALVGAGLVTFGAILLYSGGIAGGFELAASLACGAVFCGLAYWTETRRPWLWAALALPPAAIMLALSAAELPVEQLALALGLLALLYFALSEPLAGWHRPAAAPALLIALALSLVALPTIITSAASARLALPPLVLLGAAAFALVEMGRFRWTGNNRLNLASGGLAAAGLLLFAWLTVMLESALSRGTAGLILLPLAALAFAGARWWPGRRQPQYDLVLQAVGSLVALRAGGAALVATETQIAAALLLTLILGGQAAVRRLWPWSALSLACGLAAIALIVERLAPASVLLDAATLAAVGTAATYSLSGALLRRTRLSYWTWPAVIWGGFVGLTSLAFATLQLSPVEPASVVTLLGLAALLGAHTALWRRPELGYAAAPLLALGVGLAATCGFFTPWQPAPGDLAYVLCAIVLGLALLGQLLRRFGRGYAWPYELLAFFLLPAAPLLAAGRAEHLTLTWAMLALLYGAALWRYRVPWMLAPAFVAVDMALLHGSAWLLPGGNPASAGLLLAGAVWVQALVSAWMRRRPAMLGPCGLWGYLSTAIGGLGALALTLGSTGHGAVVSLALALLLAVLVWIEAREEAAWASLGLLALGLALAHDALGLRPAWSLLAGSLEALLVFALGWGVTTLTARLPRLAPWRHPLEYGAAGAVLALPVALVFYSLAAASAFLGAGLLLLGLAAGIVGWRRALPVLAAPALASWTIALVAEGSLSSPVAWVALDAYLLLGLAWAQGLAAVWAGRRRGTALSYPVYGASLFAGALALLLAWGASSELAVVAGALAALWALAASVERSEPVTWGAFALLITALGFGGDALGISPDWTAAWLTLGMVGVCGGGWAAGALGLPIWRRTTSYGALAVAALAVPLALVLGGELPPLTFALASLGLLLATTAVRERELYYAYGSGAAFVGAALCQLADWGLSEPQWYVLPAGLYLLALAAGLRRFQGQRRASQVVETAAVVLLLGVTFGQAIRPEGGLPYSLLLFGEALVVAAYGALGRLRVPFVGGVAFFVAGVTWMTVDTVRLTNQWVLLGAVGLLMVAAYVVLERHQERLAQAGRYWATQLRSWG